MTELEKAMKETAEAAIGMLKKSQMSLDFSAPNPHDHHKEYTRVNQSGTVSHIKAKGVQVKGRKVYHNNVHVADIIGNRGRDHKGNVVVDLDVRMKDGTFLNDKLRGKWSYFADVVSDLKNNPEWLGITQAQPATEQAKTAEQAPARPDRKTYKERRIDQAVNNLISIHGGVYGTTDPDRIMETMTTRRGFTEEEVREAAKRIPSTQDLFDPPKPIWDSDAAVNDTKDIKRRLVAAGFKPREWSVKAGTVTSGPRKGEIDDAKISNRYPLQHADVVARTQALLDAGFDVTWNTMVRENGQRLTVPTVYSVPRQGKVTILDADKPVGERLTTYSTQAEAEAALNHSTNQP
ncbi:MAG: hypothetical protein AB7I29_14240 [Geobacter sp.]